MNGSTLHPPCGEHYSTVDSAFVFEIYQRRAGQGATTDVFFGLNVPCVDAAVNSATANQGNVVRAPEDSEWGRSAIIQDLDGHRVMLTEQAG